MNQCFLKKEYGELDAFPHIVELAIKKISTIQFESFKKSCSDHFCLFYIMDGRFSWIVDNERYTLYPGDLLITLPGQCFGGEKDFFELGTVAWLKFLQQPVDENKKLDISGWTCFSHSECNTIERILTLNNNPVVSGFKEGAGIFQTLQAEFQLQEIGYTARINQLLHELIILSTRQITRQNSSRKDFPQTFMKLEQALRNNLSHQWTVEEMAALMALGTTAFSEKVKSFTGFSPLNYLINIRISAALTLLKQPDISVTDIALEVGFYSSQHFATTFKKLTGYTPSEFRKNNISEE